VEDETKNRDRRGKMPGATKTGQTAERRSSQGVDCSRPEGTMRGSQTEGLSPGLQAHIGRHVRAVFDEVAREPVPERLLRLLKELEQSGDK
jgi:Anti-sigma factor NepR